MLVLTRRPNETIRIGDDVEIVVLEADPRGRVRLGIIAPPGVPVDRLEVHLKKQQERSSHAVTGNH